jgi:hypothetical protein
VAHPPTADLEALIAALFEAGVEHIVVGGAAAVLHGAPITTQDLDVVYRRTAENLDRLEVLLARLDAVARDPAGRRLPPNRSHLESGGVLQLDTSLGPFDPMAKLADGRGYDELLAHSVAIQAEGFQLLVLDLPTLIEVKVAVSRAKDRLMLPVLLALLAERDRTPDR